MKRVFLYAYDQQNLGDDLFVHTIVNRYPHVQFYMWSDRKNRKTFASLPNLKVIDKDSAWVRLLRKLRPSLVARYKSRLEKRCDAVVYIGGSIFMEYENGEGIPALWNYLAENHALYVLGANFGPYLTEAYRDSMASAFRKMADLCFRDQYSVKLFENVPSIRCAPDILLAYPMPVVPLVKKQLFVSVIDCSAKTEAAHSLAHFEDTYILHMSQLLQQYFDAGWSIVFSSFCESEGDLAAIHKLLRKMNIDEKTSGVSLLSYNGENTADLIAAISASEHIISSRFHGVILALAAGKSVFPVIYSDKTARALQDLDFKGKWADLRTMKTFSFEDSITNLNMTDSCWDDMLPKQAEQHFAKLDKMLSLT